MIGVLIIVSSPLIKFTSHRFDILIPITIKNHYLFRYAPKSYRYSFILSTKLSKFAFTTLISSA